MYIALALAPLWINHLDLDLAVRGLVRLGWGWWGGGGARGGGRIVALLNNGLNTQGNRTSLFLFCAVVISAVLFCTQQ